MVKLSPFRHIDFDRLIQWIDSETLLVQIAGTYFTYPLTTTQLEHYLADNNSFAFNLIAIPANNIIGHAEIILVNDVLCKIDKLIIGDTTNRGKGTGRLVIQELLQYCFMQLNATMVELNVYDFNIAGIKCYEKAGFTFTDKIQATNFKEETWTAKNMAISMDKWLTTYNAQF